MAICLKLLNVTQGIFADLVNDASQQVGHVFCGRRQESYYPYFFGMYNILLAINNLFFSPLRIQRHNFIKVSKIISKPSPNIRSMARRLVMRHLLAIFPIHPPWCRLPRIAAFGRFLVEKYWEWRHYLVWKMVQVQAPQRDFSEVKFVSVSSVQLHWHHLRSVGLRV